MKLTTLIKSDLKAPFSIATTPGYRKGATLFPGLLHFTLGHTLQRWVLSNVASSTIFWVFGMNRPGIEPLSRGPPAKNLLIMPMARFYQNYMYFISVFLNSSVCRIEPLSRGPPAKNLLIMSMARFYQNYMYFISVFFNSSGCNVKNAFSK